MIFKNINLWNVSEVEYDKETNAYRLFRLKKDCEKDMLEQGRNMNHSSVGVELRFKMVDDEVKIVLKTKGNEAAQAYLYFGSVQGEWNQSSFTITNEDSVITIKKIHSSGIEVINGLKKSIYPSDLVRILFDGKEVQIADVIGKVEPALDLLPNKTYLAYGSSITANSITFIPMISYPSLLANNYQSDLINLGSPGSCRMEKEVADVLAKDIKFDFATIELGINIIDDMEEKEFYKRAYYLVNQVSLYHPDSKIFVIDIYTYFNEVCGVDDLKLQRYRNIVKKICKEIKRDNIIYLSAKQIFKTRKNLSADLVHPDLFGHFEIFNNLVKKMDKYL